MSKLRLKTGEKKTLNITITRKVNGIATPVDLTGATITLRAKRTETDPDNRATISATTNTHTNPTAGQSALILDATAITTELEGFYDIAISWPSGDVMKSMTGKFVIEQAITRAV